MNIDTPSCLSKCAWWSTYTISKKKREYISSFDHHVKEVVISMHLLVALVAYGFNPDLENIHHTNN